MYTTQVNVKKTTNEASTHPLLRILSFHILFSLETSYNYANQFERTELDKMKYFIKITHSPALLQIAFVLNIHHSSANAVFILLVDKIFFTNLQ